MPNRPMTGAKLLWWQARELARLTQSLPTTSEAMLQRQMRELAGLTGWRCYHTYRSDRSEPGFPDWVMFRRERLLFVELKSARGQLSDAQGRWIDGLKQCREIAVHVWRPQDWDQIVQELRQ